MRLKEINLNDFIEEKDLLVEQAKKMEKEQKEKEYEQGAKDAWDAFYEITQSE